MGLVDKLLHELVVGRSCHILQFIGVVILMTGTSLHPLLLSFVVVPEIFAGKYDNNDKQAKSQKNNCCHFDKPEEGN